LPSVPPHVLLVQNRVAADLIIDLILLVPWGAL